MAKDEQVRKHFSVSKVGKDLIKIVFHEDVSPAETTRAAQLIEDDIFAILNQDPNQNYNGLINIEAIGGSNFLTPEAMRIYSRLPRLRQLKKSAMVGNNTVLEMFANLVIQSSGKELNFRWCKSEKEAMEWIKGN